jgi:valyl-tRNA synthetase
VAESLRVLTSPVRVTGGLRIAQLLTLATSDAIAREAAARGTSTEWIPGVLAGDLASQLAVEQELAREGLDRAALGREDFSTRARAAEAEGRAAAEASLAVFGVHADLTPGALDNDATAVAARTAFVRLYEAGLLVRAERVVDVCPRCATVVDDVDEEAGTAPAERLRLALVASNGAELAIDLVCTELLPGAAAVAVPPDHPAAGASLELPLAGRAVAVVADDGREAASLVFPGHDAGDLELARRLGIAPAVVLDTEGTVIAPGPLEGLSRYAARAAATELLHAEGRIGAVEEVEEPVYRCRRCGTVVVPRLGRHWFLPMADLEVLAADAVRQGTIAVAPPTAGDDLIAAAGVHGEWCLSHQVWAGQPVPVATCLDCGQAEVSVEPMTSCRKCMGALVADDDVLDARFVGAVWPMAVAGWPQHETGPADAAPSTLLVVAPTGLILWAARMAGLTLRLTGSVPFSRVAVHPPLDPMLYLEPVVDVGEAAVALLADARAAGADLATTLL